MSRSNSVETTSSLEPGAVPTELYREHRQEITREREGEIERERERESKREKERNTG